MGKKFTTQQFIEKANIVHNYKFNYDLVNYKNSITKVKITCPKHGIFQQIANAHLQGNGCKKCMYDVSRLTTKQFINRAKQKHGNKFDYSLAVYKGNKLKVKLICNNCNGTFSTKAGTHLEGYNCPLCKKVGGYSKTQWVDICNSNKEKIPIVYIIRCFNNNENFIKIGRTSQFVHRRFHTKSSMPYSYETIKEIKGSPDFIFDKENELQKFYKEFKYRPLIRFDGITECFNISILQNILKH